MIEYCVPNGYRVLLNYKNKQLFKETSPQIVTSLQQNKRFQK